jgi:ABC-type sugar transport system permease subunit
MQKGVEQPQLIVYVLFTVILTLSGIYVAFTYLGGIDIQFEFQDYASRLNLVTSKMIYSPDCFGVETTYAKDGTHYQKAIGVVNWTKFNSTSRIPSLCISGGENQTWVRLTFVDSNIIDTVWSCPSSSSNCKEPTTDQFINEWQTQGMTRRMLVFIQNGTSLDLGKLEVRLKG